MRSLRRCSWFCTCAHCALTASSCPTNLLYEQPDKGRATSPSRRSRAANLRVVFIVSIPSLSVYQPEPPPPLPLPPPPNPPKPPPNPPPPEPPPKPPLPPNGPTPLDHPLHGPPPQNNGPMPPPPIRLMMRMAMKIASGSHRGNDDDRSSGSSSCGN